MQITVEFKCIIWAVLKLRHPKCSFSDSIVEFLEYFVSSNGIGSLEDGNIAANEGYSRRRNFTSLTCCAIFIIDSLKSMRRSPLLYMSCPQEGRKKGWNRDADNSFKSSQLACIGRHILFFPRIDKPFAFFQQFLTSDCCVAVKRTKVWNVLSYFVREQNTIESRETT